MVHRIVLYCIVTDGASARAQAAAHPQVRAEPVVPEREGARRVLAVVDPVLGLLAWLADGRREGHARERGGADSGPLRAP